jgi:hypothetical protein
MMKTLLLFSTFFALQAFAFPSALLRYDLSSVELQRITELADKIATASRKRQAGLDILNVGFDADAQKVDTSGEHEYVSGLGLCRS